MIHRIWLEILSFLKADDIILNYPNIKSEKNRVNLHYYHAELQNADIKVESNLGDYLSKVIVQWMCLRNGIDIYAKVCKKEHLYAVGSILQMGYQNATVWGSGFAFEPSALRGFPHRSCFQKLTIRCVRGPKTRKTLLRLGHDCPELYGDPAVLMPLIYDPKPRAQMDYLVIPHYTRYAETVTQCGDEHCLSMNTNDYQTVIDRICSAKKVISSSLHGIILAESYGVPAVYYQDRPSRLGYKYEDWYMSTGRKIISSSAGWRESLTQSGSLLSSKMLKKLQNNLLYSFPKELWGVQYKDDCDDKGRYI